MKAIGALISDEEAAGRLAEAQKFEGRKERHRLYRIFYGEEERERARLAMREWSAKNREVLRERERERSRWRTATATPHQKEQHRQMMKKVNQRRIFARYDLTEEDVRAMLVAQEFRCKVCATSISMETRHIDHDHRTKKVRGLLCGQCNVALGMAKDDPERLRKLAVYLESFRYNP